MQNPCSCHWRELTDFLSTSRSSRKDKEIWEISSLAAIWEPAGPRHAAPIETVAACPLACRWHRRGSAGFLNLGWKHSVRGRPVRCPLRHAPGVPQTPPPKLFLFWLIFFFLLRSKYIFHVFIGFFPFHCSDKQSSERR